MGADIQNSYANNTVLFKIPGHPWFFVCTKIISHGYQCKDVYASINFPFLLKVHRWTHVTNPGDIHSGFSAESHLSFITSNKEVDSTNDLALDFAPVSLCPAPPLCRTSTHFCCLQSPWGLSFQYFCFCCIRATSFVGSFIRVMCSVCHVLCWIVYVHELFKSLSLLRMV